MVSPFFATVLLAQGDQSSVLEYFVALVATVLVLLVVCWPAHRKDPE